MTRDKVMYVGSTGVFTFAIDHQPIREAQATVVELEELGYRSVWIPELTGREALTHASVLLAATERMVIANGIARTGDRTPRAAAAAQRKLADAYPGRHLLGLGLGRPKAGGPGPVEAMRAYLDAMVSAEIVSSEPERRPVRVLASYGPAMMRLAAERAAGAHTYLVPVEHRPLDVIEPLDLGSLAASVEHEDVRPEIDSDLVVGHLHLHVGDLQRGLAFYRDMLGFDLVTFLPGTAAFHSTGGYHFHLAFNLWRGEGARPAPAGTVGLRHWTIVLENPEEVDERRTRVRAAGRDIEEYEEVGLLVRDPWNIATVFACDRR